MNKRFVMLIAATLMISGSLFAEAGRYQLVVSGDKMFKIDTSTGKTWKYTYMLFTDKSTGKTKQIPIYYWEEINDWAKAQKDIEYLRELAEKAKQEKLQKK
ncbi:MAG TPA: hypothetical protein PKN36_10360 [bacterium]|nr:hypothetical protein [bacterium]